MSGAYDIRTLIVGHSVLGSQKAMLLFSSVPRADWLGQTVVAERGGDEEGGFLLAGDVPQRSRPCVVDRLIVQVSDTSRLRC